MTAKAALAAALLQGQVLTVKNCFQTIGLTNIAREIPRLIEKPFGVEVSRTEKNGTSKWGQPVSYVEYRLNRTDYNKPGIEKMKEYVRSQMPDPAEAKTTAQKQAIQQLQLSLKM